MLEGEKKKSIEKNKNFFENQKATAFSGAAHVIAAFSLHHHTNVRLAP